MSSGNETLSLDLAQVAIILELGRTIVAEVDGIAVDGDPGDGGCLESDGVND